MSSPSSFPGRWMWLFPLTYFAHAAEEVWAGVGYAAWISELSEQTLAQDDLIAIHLALLVGMLVVGAVVRAQQRYYWSIVAFGVVVVGNALLHLVASLATRTYSPGLFTGLVAWGPLGVYCLARAGRNLRRGDVVWGVALGAAATAIITLFALRPGLLRLP